MIKKFIISIAYLLFTCQIIYLFSKFEDGSLMFFICAMLFLGFILLLYPALLEKEGNSEMLRENTKATKGSFVTSFERTDESANNLKFCYQILAIDVIDENGDSCVVYRELFNTQRVLSMKTEHFFADVNKDDYPNSVQDKVFELISDKEILRNIDSTIFPYHV